MFISQLSLKICQPPVHKYNVKLGETELFSGEKYKITKKTNPSRHKETVQIPHRKTPSGCWIGTQAPSCCEMKMVIHQQMVVHVLLCVAEPALHLLYVLLRACSRSQAQEHELLLPAVVQSLSNSRERDLVWGKRALNHRGWCGWMVGWYANIAGAFKKVYFCGHKDKWNSSDIFELEFFNHYYFCYW